MTSGSEVSPSTQAHEPSPAVRQHRLPRPVSTVLDPLQPIPDRKKRLPLQVLGLVVAALAVLALAVSAWLLSRPTSMTVDQRVLQGRTTLGDLMPEPARPLSTSSRVKAPHGQ